MTHLFQIKKQPKEFNGRCPDCDNELNIVGIRVNNNSRRLDTDRMIKPNGVVRYSCSNCGTKLIRNETSGSISAFLLDEGIWEDFYV